MNDVDLENISEFSNYSVEQIESILIRMQSFEPNGVFARNLKECLNHFTTKEW